jgi:hypothetical protein
LLPLHALRHLPSQINCVVFYAQGNCRYGNRCQYPHATTTTSVSSNSAPSNRSTRPPSSSSSSFEGPVPTVCRYWLHGKFRNGTACRFRHVSESYTNDMDEQGDGESDEDDYMKMHEEDINEMLCYGIKPWEVDAWEQLEAIRDGMNSLT